MELPTSANLLDKLALVQKEFESLPKGPPFVRCVIAEWPAWTSLQFLEPLVFQAADLPDVPFDDRVAPAVDAAEQLLINALARGPRYYREVLAEGATSGVSRSSLYRACRRMSVLSVDGVWSLDTTGAIG